jgi:hypothetical protein
MIKSATHLPSPQQPMTGTHSGFSLTQAGMSLIEWVLKRSWRWSLLRWLTSLVGPPFTPCHENQLLAQGVHHYTQEPEKSLWAMSWYTWYILYVSRGILNYMYHISCILKSWSISGLPRILYCGEQESILDVSCLCMYLLWCKYPFLIHPVYILYCKCLFL